MIKARVFLTRPFPETVIHKLKAEISDFSVNSVDNPLKKEILVEKVKGCHAIMTMLHDKINADVMDAAGKQLRVIANYAVGFDNIDIKTATERNILVTNTPGVLTDATADLAWALLFSVARHIPLADKYTRDGKFTSWGPLLFLGGDIRGKAIGIIGAGRIGTAMAKRSIGWEMPILYTARRSNQDLDSWGARKVSLEELMRKSDYISLHVPFTPETHHLINKETLALMKPGAYIINTARGAVINEADLVEVLKQKKIAGAGLDVFEFEPKIHAELMGLKNVVMAPHIGSATVETRTKMAQMVAQSVIDGLAGQRPEFLVNSEVWKK